MDGHLSEDAHGRLTSEDDNFSEDAHGWPF